MCLAYPGTVKKINGKSLTVSYPSGTKRVLSGDEKVKIGDRVLVQMGIVIKVLTPVENQSIIDAWESLK